MRVSTTVLAVVALVSAVATSNASDIRTTDLELAKLPVAVIGYWVKGPLKPHIRMSGNALEGTETFTHLVITKVLRGDAKLGDARLLCRLSTLWRKDGKAPNQDGQLVSDWEQPPFEVTDVTKPHLWLLERVKSWDTRDPKTYLSLDNVRGVQDLKFEPLFTALASPNRNLRITQCLESSDSEVVGRALQFVSGDSVQWPLESLAGLFNGGSYARSLHRDADALPAVRDVIDGKLEKCRPMAAALYAEMSGRSTEPLMASLLSDANSEVRTVAAAYLVKFGSKSNLEGIRAACRDTEDPTVACALILEIGNSKDERYVPALIECLQNGSSGVSMFSNTGIDMAVPALYAQASLKAITGFTFPLDVEASQRAWKETEASPDRLLALGKRLGDWTKPIEAVVRPVLDKSGRLLIDRSGGSPEPMAEVTLTNQTDRSLKLLREPNDVFLSGGSSSSSGSSFSEDNYVTIPAHQSFKFTTSLMSNVFEPHTKQVMILGYNDGRVKLPTGSWMGYVKAKVIPLSTARSGM